ncbi:MAG: pyruvate kinase [Alcanivoracaceae bacterium]
MFRRTKIVATVGPASASADMLGCLIAAGVNVFRLNFSHGSAADHQMVAARIRAAADEQQRNVAILADLQGPKIRVGRFRDGPVQLLAGAPFILDAAMDELAGEPDRVGITYKELVSDCRVGDTLLLDDGLIELAITDIVGSELRCVVTVGGRLSNNKGVNRKGGGLTAPALTEKDLADIIVAAGMEVDYLAISFPRDAADVDEARHLYRAAGGRGGMIAKIERAEAVSNSAILDDIICASDGVMVARGDLAVEIGDAELVGVQKHIIQRARDLDRFVITATQMMESMIHSPQPTRAEVSDVANAVLDGTDAVMLSAETAVGDHPEATVRTMHRIIMGAERTFQTRMLKSRPMDRLEKIDEAIAVAAMSVANHLDRVKAIITMTETGNTPRMMSRVRSGIPIFAFTPHAETRRRLAIYRGVEAAHFDSATIHPDEINSRAAELLVAMQVAGPGDRVILTKGDYLAVHGGTNTLKIVEIPAEAQ